MGRDQRVPAAFCGLVGLKATSGIIPAKSDWASSGLIIQTVTDAAMVLDVVAGYTARTRVSVPKFTDSYGSAITGSVAGKHILWSDTLGLDAGDPRVIAGARAAVERLTELGAIVVEKEPTWAIDIQQVMWESIWLPHYGLWFSEVAQLTELPNPLMAEIVAEAKTKTMLELMRRHSEQNQLWQKWQEYLADFDAVCSPIVACFPFDIDNAYPAYLADGSLADRILGWLYTYPMNLLGLPAMSVPVSGPEGELPIGVQVTGQKWSEQNIFDIGIALELAHR